MKSTALPVVSETRNNVGASALRVKTLSNSHNMPFAWCIQASPTPAPTQPRQVVVMNCPPETYLG